MRLSGTRSTVLVGIATLVLASTAPAASAAVDEPVGRISADITRAYHGGTFVDGRYRLDDDAPRHVDPAGESTLGALVAEALAASAVDPVIPVVGVVSPTSLGADLLVDDPDRPGEPGEVTRADVAAVLPADEQVWSTQVTGAQLRELLEQQWPAADAPAGRGYLQLGLSSNVAYTYDEARPAGQRVTSATLDGYDVSTAAEIEVRSTRALVVDGADGFTVLTQGNRPGGARTTSQEALVAALAAARVPVEPDVRERALGLTGLPERPAPGQHLVLGVSGLNLRSLGAPLNTTVDVLLDDDVLASDVPLTLGDDARGSADVGVVLPDRAGIAYLRVVAAPSGTTVRVMTVLVRGPDTTWTLVQAERTTQMYGVLWPVVRLGVVVSWAPGPTGDVEVLVDDEPVSTHRLDERSRAVVDLPHTLPAGECVVVVRYLGDATHAPSRSDPLRVTVERTTSATRLAVRRPVAGLPRVWTAEVRLASGARPVGRVELREGDVVRARSRLVAGVAGGAVPALSSGTHRLTAVFVPDDGANVAGSGSAEVTVTG